ncbi:MAG: Na/Pi symporter [Proteobacteria bacterium]|nr:Na/Pi symporter [Pseudomonadota bacterium]
MSQLNFLFGLGIFLFGMSQLEYGIRKLSDARLRHWLRSSTGSRLGSVSTGIVTTALLQSSSMVSLLVLAFAGAGLIPLINSIGIILGANLGTTFTGWIVAIFGFKLDLEAIALPLFGSAAFVLALSKRDTRLNYAALVVFGIALLLFGLGIMKTSMETLPQRWDVSILQGHHPVVYLLFGVVITFLVQSSSAVMMMALAALNAEFIALPEAVALIIGADLGTTSTTALGSLSGSTIKRELAFAHFSFNFIVDISAFVLLLPFLTPLMALLALEDPLYSLVAFHSLMNLLGLLIFIPLLTPFAAWIEQLFARGIMQSSSVIDRVPADVVDAALVAVRDTVRQLLLQACCNSLFIFDIKPTQLKKINAQRESVMGTEIKNKFSKGYEELKNQESEILSYSRKIQAQPLDENAALELERLQTITRHVVFANKSLKDIQRDLDEFRINPEKTMQELHKMHRQFQNETYETLIDLMLGEHTPAYVLEELADIQEKNDKHTEAANHFVQTQAGSEFTEGTAVSMEFNSNREIRYAIKTLSKAIGLWVRTEQIAIVPAIASLLADDI